MRLNHRYLHGGIRVLSVFSNWMEDYGMPQDDPQLTLRLRDFLQTVQTPHNIALTARLMIQSIDRLVSSGCTLLTYIE